MSNTILPCHTTVQKNVPMEIDPPHYENLHVLERIKVDPPDNENLHVHAISTSTTNVKTGSWWCKSIWIVIFIISSLLLPIIGLVVLVILLK
jgi:hypothetical protein